MMILLSTVVAQGQIKIGGNVYGGGNHAYVQGNTNVTVLAGDIGARPDENTVVLEHPAGKVFGGARQADVGGNTFVHIDGERASADMLINQVYGGNDVSGVVGKRMNDADFTKRAVPEKLAAEAAADGVDNTWNTFVLVSSKMTSKAVHYTQAECDDYNTRNNLSRGDYGFLTTRHVNPLTPGVLDEANNKKIFIGQLFGGGNGDFTYTPDGEDTYTVTEEEDNQTVVLATKAVKPELAKSYIAIHGGTIADSYGGGNGATVTEQAVVCVDNPSLVVTDADVKTMLDTDNDDVMNARYEEMGFTILSQTSSSDFQMGSVFGGNKSAEMAIRPTWHLQDGKIRNLYSGGNRGDMTYKDGLFLEIPTYSSVVVDNVYGGCRMADVNPKENGEKVAMVSSEDLLPYQIPANLAARVVVAGGDVNNVYGGNDVRGKVYFGNAVGILTSVRGDVYGGGNGAYAYTDQLSEDKKYSDYYFSQGQHSSLMDALNATRPNAEQVSIHVRGYKEKKTVIKGSIFVGGNCASLVTDPAHASLANYPLTELKVGSYVIAEKVFLGNNGDNMVSEDILKLYANQTVSDFSSFDLTTNQTFASYMGGVSLAQVPRLIVEDKLKGDRVSYKPYTSYIGSLYYGGNRGSMTYKNAINIKPDAEIYIYNKLVAGCNNANVSASQYNARYEGGILGSSTETDYSGDRIVMNLSKIRLKPMRLNSAGTDLEWNTVLKGHYVAVPDGTTLTKGSTYYTSAEGAGQFTALGTEESDGSNYYSFATTEAYAETGSGTGTGKAKEEDLARRLVGGNIYGGCYTSGHVNGNVVINLNDSLLNRKEIFAAFEGEEVGDNILYNYSSYTLKAPRNSGVILNEQGMDVLGEALTVYGGGKGQETEIWGSATVNINRGYTFQVFGGSEEGAIGKGTWNSSTNQYDYPTEYVEANHDKYSTHVNLSGTVEGEARGESGTSISPEIPDVEFIYGGGFSGPIVGNTYVHLDNGRLFNLFAGSCNADINGHTETYVGLNGFPYLRDHIYGGNDLGGSIKGEKDFTSKVRTEALPRVHTANGKKDVLKASSYVEYRQGAMKEIFGGCFGDYDYEKEYKDFAVSIPWLHNAFVNFRPDDHGSNHVDKVFGAGEGMAGIRIGDKMQDRSYVLIDIPDNKGYYSNTEVFGAGCNNGLGMKTKVTYVHEPNESQKASLDNVSAIIDLVHGKVKAAYGGSYNEGVTRRTVVNVPDGATISVDSIFGGAYGTQILPPCDVYESNVNYQNTSETASVRAIFGGNNNERRTLYAKVNISSPVWKHPEKDSLSNVYGAGRGIDTWAEYTEVNLKSGAKVFEVYGGGEMGHVLNTESVQQYMYLYRGGPSAQIAHDDPHWDQRYSNWNEAWTDAWALGDYFTPTNFTTDYIGNEDTDLTHISERSELDANTSSQLAGKKKFNTNVIINEGATVVNYVYGGGWGKAKVERTGDVYGTTYVALLGGTVNKDIYAAGTAGGVYDLFGAKNFTARANAFIQGGTVRNVYGGGWRGHIGKHTKIVTQSGKTNEVNAGITDPFTGDIFGETRVVIGKIGGSSYTDGIPSVKRNVYGGGEGGSVYGRANVFVNNGYIGYRYDSQLTDDKKTLYEDERYVEELDDVAAGDNQLDDSGNIFGGGYIANSYVDSTNVVMYGGIVRGGLHGGGEIGPVGRGTMSMTASATTAKGGLYNKGASIFKAGRTLVQLFDGWVKRDVYGGGRGFDNWGGDGWMSDEEKLTMDQSAKGYVFGQTEVDIYGGEVGTDDGVARGYGNVFGGGNIGFVYSAYEYKKTTTENNATTTEMKLGIGKQTATGKRFDEGDECYYYKSNGTSFINDAGATITSGKILTEDCKVLVEPWCKANTSITINTGKTSGTGLLTRTFAAGEFVPTAYLNYLGNKTDKQWEKLREDEDDPNRDGIVIHNAVFAGGNTSPGSDVVHVNTTTVFGNATASIHDVYHRDLITIGTGHTGGLYGDGNLTFIDGYRELNITNYGTDYYSITPEITLEQYEALPVREGAYYERRYKCVQPCKDHFGKNYGTGSTITEDEVQTLFIYYDETNGEYVSVTDNSGTALFTKDEDGRWTPNEAYWEENGVCSRYAGRIMNTVQRADFCGVYGSRMVMQGAQDRVPETVDYTNYTINRVREVSLNKKVSDRTEAVASDQQHGNYFGIYNTVHFLGALTSDVDFGDGGTTSVSGAIRETENDDEETYQCAAGGKDYGEATYYDWKAAFYKDRKRNNGSSYNKVALASGVYLELTTEQSTGDGLYEKDWGYITGVVELDLINVQPGMGGGFVYAKNVHGARKLVTDGKQLTLTALNSGAVSRKKYTYATAVEANKWESSGNFVHSSQTIIDDCYNMGNMYHGTDSMPAHYWYIKGAVYVYDQYISAYTGAPNAFSQEINIPLTITSASHGKMILRNVQPNYYAYRNTAKEKLGPTEELELRDVSYKLNDPISYWDYYTLNAQEKQLFVSKTYVTTDSCKIGNTVYPPGYVMLPANSDPNDPGYNNLKAVAETNTSGKVTIMTKDAQGNDVEKKDYNGDVIYKPFDEVFHESNNLSHETGYILTYKVDNPNQWNTWYSPKSGSSLTYKIDSKAYDDTKKPYYEDGPTYTPINSGVYGQLNYQVGNVISEKVYNSLTAAQKADLVTAYINEADETKKAEKKQAEFKPAYIVTSDILEATNSAGTFQRLYKGSALAKEDYTAAEWTRISGSVAEACVVTNTIILSETKYIYRDTLMTASEKTTLYNKYASGTDAEKKIAADIAEYIVPAYYCTDDGKYGGSYYTEGQNYRAIDAFSSLSDSDRKNFKFNYDALDLLIDPTYSGTECEKYQYDGEGYDSADDADDNRATYSLQTPIDYTATFSASGDLTSIEYESDELNSDGTTHKVKIAEDGTVLSRTEYERLPNERYYYSSITVKKDKYGQLPQYYYVVNETMVIGDTPYAAGQVIDYATYESMTDKSHITKLQFTEEGTYYYCREGYTINASQYPSNHATKGKVTNVIGVNGVSSGTSFTSTVPKGIVIAKSDYDLLINKQLNFNIHGLSPTETSTLYVIRNSDIKDLSTEKIITVMYQYDYVETDNGGMNITPVSEWHVLNIHINFKSGVPTVDDIMPPSIVLPGTSISMIPPHVEPGAYLPTGGGWELFDDPADAESHTNGIEYKPGVDSLFLYQNEYLLAYYATTYLGKTYSNAVPVRVANYHDLKKVMGDKYHHYYIDHNNVHNVQKVAPKIYINDYSNDEEGSKNGLDLFKDLYDLSLVTGSGNGYTVTGNKITGTEGSANSNLEGHALLNTNTRAERNLEFFLRTDIKHTGSWTPIGYDGVCDDPSTPNVDEAVVNNGQCFDGVLHGDGHTISGLGNSLFNYLCGEVYNLGVTGSFTGAGIAENGGGYVESCWVNTTGTPDGSVRAVFGNPSAASDYKQVVNSYCQEGKTYNITDTGNHGLATAKPNRAFYNGEVAYDLNNFYLYKRYNDGVNTSSGAEYKYWKSGETEPQTGYYADHPDLCSSGYKYKEDSSTKYYIRYVEDRFADGDFIYAGGSIPTTENIRLYTDDDGSHYYPIWPDDYLFFGQTLTYDHVKGRTHQDTPSYIIRSNERVVMDESSNRVYRAPAYYRNSKMDVAHFNPDAVFAKSKKNHADVIAYENMTAIDFTGSNGDVAGGYHVGTNNGKFYPPLLDDDGLTGFSNIDLTKNLLAYTEAVGDNQTAAEKTASVVSSSLYDPVYTETDATYRTVAMQSADRIKGHWVKMASNGSFEAVNDHLLVDKQDFDAPMSYSFAEGKRMWYQRIPEYNEYVDRKKGWQAISLPFTAELVTTNQKGEITHFYSGSYDFYDKNTGRKDGKSEKVGHEYWLRELTGDLAVKAGTDNKVLTAGFAYPTGTDGDPEKEVSNTFLWDFYYKGVADGHKQKDFNKDIYQEYYSDDNRVYEDYPLLANGTPYVLGLPGTTYYEFDLSGRFEASTTDSPKPDRIGKQTITFASVPGTTIRVSDDEKLGKDEQGRYKWKRTVRIGNNDVDYYFKANYLNQSFKAGTSNFTLHAEYDSNGDGEADCSSFVKVPDAAGVGESSVADTELAAFRPFFTTDVPVINTRSIVFGSEQTEEQKGVEEHGDPTQEELNGGLRIWSKKDKIYVESSLRFTEDMRIVTPAGITVATFSVKSGQTVEVQADFSGIYIVHTLDGKYTKKVTVKK